jgi:hypothetical protein
MTGKQGYKRARIGKVIFLGLDGLDPDLCDRFIAEGKLPHLAKLKEQGCYRRLRTTYPPLSPVAWSTFATGVNPAKHSLYDFLNRSMKTYVPELSSSRVSNPTRILKLGAWRIPLSRASVEMRLKSRTFWSILGEHHIGCSILRVPITFPPEKFNGKMLSAMCTPDLLGTQGTFQQFTTKLEQSEFEGGTRLLFERDGKQLRGMTTRSASIGNHPGTCAWNSSRWTVRCPMPAPSSAAPSSNRGAVWPPGATSPAPLALVLATSSVSLAMPEVY